MAGIDLSPTLGQAALFGPTGIVGPVLTAAGMAASADFAPGNPLTPTSRFPQTERWPLPGSGQLHPLDMIKILGVWLPLAEMPEYGTGLDVSHRKAKGSDHATLVSHGKLTHPVKIKLRLWRDTTLGYKEGVRVGKDWHYEWEKIERLLIPEKLEKRGAVSVEYPLMASRGCDSVIFTEIGPYHRAGGQFYTIELKGYDPRTVKDNKGGSKKVVKQLDKIGSRAAPSPQRAAESASMPRVTAGNSADALAAFRAALAPPSAANRGK